MTDKCTAVFDGKVVCGKTEYWDFPEAHEQTLIHFGCLGLSCVCGGKRKDKGAIAPGLGASPDEQTVVSEDALEAAINAYDDGGHSDVTCAGCMQRAIAAAIATSPRKPSVTAMVEAGANALRIHLGFLDEYYMARPEFLDRDMNGWRESVKVILEAARSASLAEPSRSDAQNLSDDEQKQRDLQWQIATAPTPPVQTPKTQVTAKNMLDFQRVYEKSHPSMRGQLRLESIKVALEAALSGGEV